MLKQILSILFFIIATSNLLCDAELDYVYDLQSDRTKLEAQRKLRHKQLYQKGITSREAHLNVDEKFLKQARALEVKRQKSVKALFKKAEVKMPELMGTNPLKGRGIFGDIDTANMPVNDLEKLKNIVIKHNNTPGVRNKYTLSDKGAYLHIKELDMTVFKKIKNPDKFIFTRGAGKETALAYRTNNEGETNNAKVYKLDKNGKRILIKNSDAAVVDKNIYNLDNMKKIGEDFSKSKISEVDFQNTGKGTMRIIENTYGKNLEKIESPEAKAKLKKILDQCRDMKKYSPETAGLHTDAQKKAFMQDARKIIGEAYRKCAGQTEKAMIAQRDSTWGKIQKLKQELSKSKGQNPELKAELEATKKFYDAESKDLYNYRRKKLAAERGIIKNGGAELLAEAKCKKIRKIELANGASRYIDLESGTVKTKSQLQDSLLRDQRRKITTNNIPKKTSGSRVKQATPSQKVTVDTNNTVTTTRTLGRNATFNNCVNKAGDIVDIYNVYKTADVYLPKDMDPNTRKGIQLTITVASSHQVTRAVIQGTVGGAQAGFDEMVKWYKENPGREPTKWERLKIGMRGGNRFTIDLVKGMVHGMTIKPFQDIHDIGHGLGDTIYQRKNAERSTEAAKQMDTNVNAKYKQQLDSMTQALNHLDELTAKIQADPLLEPSEKAYIPKIKSESELTRKLIKNAKIVALTRNDELSVTKKIKDPKTGKEKVIIQKSKTTIEDRQKAIAFAASHLSKVNKMVEKLLLMRNTCTLTIKLVDSVTGKPLTASSWMTLRSGNYKSAPKGSAVLKANDIPGGACTISLHASGYTPLKDQKILLNPVKKRSYSYTFKLAPAKEAAPLYAQFTFTVIDSATKKPVNNVSFIINNNNKRETKFTSPTGTMKINLETGVCKAEIYAKAYSRKALNMKVDTSAAANKIINIYIEKKSATSKTTVSRKKRYTVYFEPEHSMFNLPLKSNKLELLDLTNNTSVKISRGTKQWRAYTAPGKYKLTMSGSEIKTVVKSFELNKDKMVVKIPFTPKTAVKLYSFSFKLAKFDEMVPYTKNGEFNDFFKSKMQKKTLFTLKQGGYLRMRLYAQGHGNACVILSDSKNPPLLLGYTPSYKKGDTRGCTKYYRLWDSEKGKKIIVEGRIYHSDAKHSRKSDYDDEERIIFQGGTVKGDVLFHPLPFKKAEGRGQKTIIHKNF